jgi:MFS family permease
MKKSSLPSLVVWLGLVSLLTDAATEMIYPLLPLFLSTVLGAPQSFIGAVEGAAEATASLLKLVSGRIADASPRKKPLTVLGYGISTTVRPLVGLALYPWHVLATRVADRVGKGLRSSPRDALIADATPADHRGRAYGYHQAMDNAGAVVGPLLATLLMVGLHANLRQVFLLSAIPGALAMAALLFGVKEPARPAGERKPTVAAAIAPGAWRRLTAYLFTVALFGLGNSSDAFLLLRARTVGIAAAYIPMLWLAHNATKALLSTWAGELSDRVGRRRVIIAGWMVYALVYLAFGYATSAWHIWGLFVVYGIYYALVEGVQKALVADLAPAGARGRAFGWYNAVVGLVALPASLGFGWLADHYGQRTAFSASAALALAASLLLAALVAERSSPPPAR